MKKAAGAISFFSYLTLVIIVCFVNISKLLRYK